MFKNTVNYTDFSGETKSEDFYFNISKAEILEAGIRNILTDNLAKMSAEKDAEVIYDAFTKILMISVGRRSEDGRLFIKDQEIKDHFRWSGAYDQLVFDVLSDTDKAIAFVNNLVPDELKAELNQKLEEAKK